MISNSAEILFTSLLRENKERMFSWFETEIELKKKGFSRNTNQSKLRLDFEFSLKHLAKTEKKLKLPL